MVDNAARPACVAPQSPDIDTSRLEAGALADLVDTADLDGVHLSRLAWPEVSLRDATVRETLVEQPELTTLHASGGRWRDVRVQGGRIGVLEAYDSEWRSIEMTGCRLAYVNLRGSDVADLTLHECHVDELDLGDAQLRRASLHGCRIGRLHVRGARLESVDLREASYDAVEGVEGLRGAVVTSAQLMELAPLFADALGIGVSD